MPRNLNDRARSGPLQTGSPYEPQSHVFVCAGCAVMIGLSLNDFSEPTVRVVGVGV